MAKRSVRATPRAIQEVGIHSFAEAVIPHLQKILEKNEKTLEKIAERVIHDVQANRSLFVFGSGNSALFPMELYHRAGGPSFVIPLVAEYLLPTAGPPVVRMMERTVGSANFLLDRALPRAGEMLWVASQSGINAAGVELVLEAKRRKIHTVAFTSLVHSRSVASRHPSKKKLFEVCDEVVDLGGVPGDAALKLNTSVSVGPLSSLGVIFLAHSILATAMARLEEQGVRCVYTSVNTEDGEDRNRKLEELAKIRDPLLR